MNKQTIADIEIAGKRVLIRADLNIASGPVISELSITSVRNAQK
jgi:3-phosphoglycerate kinase